MISFRSKGDFRNLEKLLKKTLSKDYKTILQIYGQRGVVALASATPKDTGITAASWSYDIVENTKAGTISVVWYNSHMSGRYNIALILQYGHGTRNGGYVEGIDYINPALRPIFDDLAQQAWKAVTDS